MATSSEHSGLARGSVGLSRVLFQSITAMAPAAGVAFSLIIASAFAGGGAPLSVVIALVGCVFAALSMGELARHLPSAGGTYTYVARGLNPAAGFLVGWMYSFIEPMTIAIGALLFGVTLSTTLNTEWGWSITPVWIAGSLFCVFMVAIAGYVGVRFSSAMGAITGAIEVVVFSLLAIWIIVKAGDRNTLAVFGTKYSTVQGFGGWTGVWAGSVYGILAFIGFEAAAPLAEEAANPRYTIGKAIVLSALAVGVFYVLTTYASAVYFGPEKFAGFSQANHGNPWDGIARHVWGLGWIVVFIALLNSAFGGANAGGNASSRTWYAMGRIRLFPRALAHTSVRHGSPDVAIGVQLVFTVALVLGLGLAYDPLPGFVLLATIVSLVVIVIYMAVNISCAVYHWRARRPEFSPARHLVIPLLGVAAFVPAFLTSAGITVFSFITPLPYPTNLAGPVVGVWLVLGLLYLGYLMSRDRQRVDATAIVFEEAQPVDEADQTTSEHAYA